MYKFESVFTVTEVSKYGFGDSHTISVNEVGEKAVQAVRRKYGICRIVLNGFRINDTFKPLRF